MIAGFWYVKDENDDAAQVTQTVVVILRNPPKRGVALIRLLKSEQTD